MGSDVGFVLGHRRCLLAWLPSPRDKFQQRSVPYSRSADCREQNTERIVTMARSCSFVESPDTSPTEALTSPTVPQSLLFRYPSCPSLSLRMLPITLEHVLIPSQLEFGTFDTTGAENIAMLVSVVSENSPLRFATGKLPRKGHFISSVSVSGVFPDRNDFTASTRSRRSCCSQHDPPPHWFTVEIPPIVLHLLGTFLALLAGLFLSVGGLAIGEIKTLKPLEISGLRSTLACVYLIPLLLYFRPKHDFGKIMMLETFGVSLVFCVKFVTFSVGSTLLPLSEFSLLCNTVPVFTALFGCVLLAEKCGFREWLSCLIVMLGVATTFAPKILEGPTSSEVEAAKMTENTEGYIITALSALSNAAALCWLRRLKEVHSLLISFYACFVTAVISLALSFISGEYRPPTDRNDMLLVALAALCMLCQALLPAIACSLTQASRVAVAMTFSVVFAFLLQAVFEGTQPTVYAIGGGFLIVVAMVVGNSPCGDENDDGLLKDDSLTRSTRYGSMNAAMDNVR